MALGDIVSFWQQVDRQRPHLCWPWTGETDDNGEPVFHLEGAAGSAPAIEFGLLLAGRPLPPGATPSRTCANRLCLNPAHIGWTEGGTAAPPAVPTTAVDSPSPPSSLSARRKRAEAAGAALSPGRAPPQGPDPEAAPRPPARAAAAAAAKSKPEPPPPPQAEPGTADPGHGERAPLNQKQLALVHSSRSTLRVGRALGMTPAAIRRMRRKAVIRGRRGG